MAAAVNLRALPISVGTKLEYGGLSAIEKGGVVKSLFLSVSLGKHRAKAFSCRLTDAWLDPCMRHAGTLFNTCVFSFYVRGK